jgi:hypothetical protein
MQKADILFTKVQLNGGESLRPYGSSRLAYGSRQPIAGSPSTPQFTMTKVDKTLTESEWHMICEHTYT